jgi:hypothetical protein
MKLRIIWIYTMMYIIVSNAGMLYKPLKNPRHKSALSNVSMLIYRESTTQNALLCKSCFYKCILHSVWEPRIIQILFRKEKRFFRYNLWKVI